MSACPSCLRRAALLARLAPYIERAATRRRGSASRDLLALADEDLAKAVGATPFKGEVHLPAPRGEGFESICRHDPRYPACLSHLGASAPHALWLRGDPALLAGLDDEPAVTIVGSRRATAYGREVAHELGLLLAGAGVCVVSGLAFGIDAASHRGALDGDGPTIAVLGCGIDVTYPVGNRRLFARIASEGLLVAEMPPGFKPFRWSFPARNRIMAALGAATVVVEAAQRSGSLITVRLAQAIGRDVGVVPGPINSRFSHASNALLADGAFPVLGAESVLDELFGPGVRTAASAEDSLEPAQQAVLEQIEAGGRTPDVVAASCGMSAGAVASALAVLELRGMVKGDSGGRYTATISATRGSAGRR